jgi:hypothetical protein
MAGETPGGASGRGSGKQHRSSRRGWIIGAASTLAVAIVGATASAVITPERIDAIFGSFGGTPPPTPTPSIVAYKSVTSLDKAITMEVPDDWAARDGAYDVTEFTGSALITGTQVETPVEFGEDGAYVGASAEFARTAQFDVATDDVIEDFLQMSVDELDWTLENCVASAEEPFAKTGWIVASKAWDDCTSVEGTRLWQVAMVPDDRSSLVSIQVLLRPGAPGEIAAAIVESIVVDSDRLPLSE